MLKRGFTVGRSGLDSLPSVSLHCNSMSLTQLETIMIKILAANEYSSFPGDPIWSNCLGGRGVPTRSIPGVVASLVKKGLASASGHGQEATVSLTDDGVIAYDLIGGGAK